MSQETDEAREVRVALSRVDCDVGADLHRIADVVNQIAAGYGASAAQVALAWVRVQQDKSVVIPIVGARTPAQFKENLGALEVPLSAADLERLDEVSRIEPGFPHDFAGAALVYGNTLDLFDAHPR